MGWVTDPDAIDTLIALKELRPGDEVVITGGANYRLLDLDGRAVVIRDDPDGYVGRVNAIHSGAWCREVCAARFIHPDKIDGIWVLCRKNIAAWRRPSELKV